MAREIYANIYFITIKKENKLTLNLSEILHSNFYIILVQYSIINKFIIIIKIKIIVYNNSKYIFLIIIFLIKYIF